MEKKNQSTLRLEKAKYLNESVELVGSSKAFMETLEKVQIYANCDENVAIYGEIGSGKTEFAKTIHLLSPRKDFPFILFDCGLLNQSLAEGELFGYRRGTFTGAIKDRIGLLEEANGGTFLLDEIGNLPLSLQVEFLRVFQDKKIRRLGENRDIKLNVRFIIATNKNLKEEVEKRLFREDLFSRLDVLEIKIPPLRDRKYDILELTDYRLFQLNRKYRRKKKLAGDLYDCFLDYSWPGNVRELNNVIIKAYFNSKDFIYIEALPNEIRNHQKINLTKQNKSIHTDLEILFDQLVKGEKDFWHDVHDAFLSRDLNRKEVRELIRIGLLQNKNKYINICKQINCDYNKFMTFLGHHNLKPQKKIFM